MNFDKAVAQLRREARHMMRLGAAVPAAARAVLLQDSGLSPTLVQGPRSPCAGTAAQTLGKVAETHQSQVAGQGTASDGASHFGHPLLKDSRQCHRML